MGFSKMKTLSQLPSFFLSLIFLAAEAQPKRRVDLYNPSLLELPQNVKRIYNPELLQRLSPKSAEKLYNPEIVQRLSPKKSEKLYNPELVQRLSPKNAEKLYNPEIVQRLTTQNNSDKLQNTKLVQVGLSMNQKP